VGERPIPSDFQINKWPAFATVFYLIYYIKFFYINLIGKFLISIISTVRPQASRRSPARRSLPRKRARWGLGNIWKKQSQQRNSRKSAEAAWSKGSHERRRDVTATQQPRYGGLALPEGNHVDG
jgi:hypothetical protein